MSLIEPLTKDEPAAFAAGRGPAHLDVLDPGFRVNSASVRAAAARHWYATTPLGPAVLRYEDCLALLHDRRLTQGSVDHLAGQGITEGPLAETWSRVLITVDGERHLRLRRLVSKAFTPREVERLRSRMRGIVDELIDGFAPLGACEFMDAFADRYPDRVMQDLLGIPPAVRERFTEWGKQFALFLSFSVAEHAAEMQAALEELAETVDRLAAERRRRPTDDLFSHMVTVSDGDDRFTVEELHSMVVILLIGGQDTIRGQLGYAMITFAEHPEQWALLAEHPELAGRATEEVMRFNPVIPIIWRQTVEELNYKDLVAPLGTRLWMMIDTVHRDEAVFGPPGFDITLERPTQLHFGGGPHYCLGAALARAELNEALPVLAARLPGLELAGTPMVRPELSGVMGPTFLPIRFRPTGI